MTSPEGLRAAFTPLSARERVRRDTNGLVLTLLREIAGATTMHHASVARDAIFHVRLMSKGLEDEAASCAGESDGNTEAEDE